MAYNYTLHFNEYDSTIRVEFYSGIVLAIEYVTANPDYNGKAWAIRDTSNKIIAAYDVAALSDNNKGAN